VTARYAIYFAPDDDSELGIFGATVLRRHALDASDWLNPEMPVEFPQSSVWSDRIQRPAHYGFHATIKAPFELSKGQVSDNLIADVADFCHSLQPISLDGLAPIRTNRFHMTLSGRNDHNDADYLNWLCRLYQSMVTNTPVLDRLCVFYQPDRTTPFVRIEEFHFGLASDTAMHQHRQAAAK